MHKNIENLYVICTAKRTNRICKTTHLHTNKHHDSIDDTLFIHYICEKYKHDQSIIII